jgi:hypothetical protein
MEICRFGNYGKEKIIKIFQEMEFYSLIDKLRELKVFEEK